MSFVCLGIGFHINDVNVARQNSGSDKVSMRWSTNLAAAARACVPRCPETGNGKPPEMSRNIEDMFCKKILLQSFRQSLGSFSLSCGSKNFPALSKPETCNEGSKPKLKLWLYEKGI